MSQGEGATNRQPSTQPRRSFLKIGTVAVVGAAAGAAAEYAYLSGAGFFAKASDLQSQLNTANSSVASLKSQLSDAEDQIESLNASEGSLQGQLNAAQSQISSLNAQVSGLQSQFSSASTQIGSLNSEITDLQSQLSAAQQASALAQQLQVEIDTFTGFLTLNVAEQPLVEAIVETIIPSDSSGPGAKEAGAIYFIDRALAGDYGKSANMFLDGPFVPAGASGPITVGTQLYPSGSPDVRVGAGTRYQLSLSMREYWRTGLLALEAYSNSAYGSNFEKLSSANQGQVLQDLWNDKPADFGGLVPSDFAYELFFMAWSGFLMDPLYGGNRGMVGWTYTGFNGVNFGDFYGEGQTQPKLMTASTPTQLQPASLAELQKGSA